MTDKRYINEDEISEQDFNRLGKADQIIHKLKGTAIVSRNEEFNRAWQAEFNKRSMGAGKTYAGINAMVQKMFGEMALEPFLKSKNKPAYRETLGKKGNKWA